MHTIPEIYRLLIFSSVSVVYLFFISKFLGKKQIAQLEFIDYVLGISVGSIAAEMATDVGDTPFYYYLIGMTIFFLFDVFVSFIGRKGPAMKHFFKGRPELIIYRGNFVYENLKKSKLDVNDVIALCREQGYFNITDVAFAIFETSGKLSILPKSHQKPTVVSDFHIKSPQAKLPFYLAVDGKISYSSLREIKKDVKWFFKKANIDKKKLKNVLLAIYDEKNDEISLQLKHK